MSVTLALPNISAQTLQLLCGADNQHIRHLEQRLQVHFLGQPGDWSIEGSNAEAAASVVRRMVSEAKHGAISTMQVEALLRDAPDDTETHELVLHAGRRRIQGKTKNQRRYVQTILDQTVTLCAGPAGTGKTWLAVAAAVAALNSHQVEKIILCRPAVEAGEKLGFLPGDMQQKVDPYLRPLFDALSDMLGLEKMQSLIETQRIEVAPLAFMRGRTLNEAFIILDEAQNTTREQIKMFLTRLGFASKMVVTGDTTQIDLPRKEQSGLLHALHVLGDVEGVGICRLTQKDVVRHELVERIVAAYERLESGE